MLNIAEYKTIVFDCDGVILDSNIVKTEAYYRTAKRLGVTDDQAQALVDYHVRLGASLAITNLIGICAKY